jgi:hypothetical protein
MDASNTAQVQKESKMKTLHGITRKQANEAFSSCAKIVKVCGGYAGFESIDDYTSWKKQK